MRLFIRRHLVSIMAKSHIKYVNRRSVIKDVTILLIVNTILLIIFSYFDSLEWLYQFSRSHENWELDEAIPLGLTLTISLLIFTYRRMSELGEVTRAFEELALLDPLTGLHNRRAAQIAITNWMAKSSNDNKFCLLQLDLDNFREFNDLYGITIGDEVLIRAAELLKSELPHQSQIFRWLDDNFLIIVPLNVKSPFELAEQLRSSIANNLMSSTQQITCSIGLCLSNAEDTAKDLLFHAEDALLNAKQAGKNCVKTN